MLPLYDEPWFTFRFADDRLIPRFHLEGLEAGRRVSVFRIDPGSGKRLGLLARRTAGRGGGGGGGGGGGAWRSRSRCGPARRSSPCPGERYAVCTTAPGVRVRAR